MRDVRATNVMMHEIENGAVWPVNRHEGSLYPRPLLIVKVWNINVSVLKPGVQNQPEVHHQLRANLESEHLKKA